MNPFYAVILGLIQGLTEFLPISSTAHLTIAATFLGLIDPRNPETWTEFIAVIQLGTLAAVLAYFFRDIVAIVKALIADAGSWGGGDGIRGISKDSWLGLYIIVGTLPVVVIGLLFKNTIEGMLTKGLLVIACSLVGLAGLLWLAERVARHLRSISEVKWIDALVIGFAQACALIPGSSRSGTTITAGLFLGLTREAAARFSFLLSIPAVFASGLYELSKIHAGVFELGMGNLVIGTVVAGVSGYAAIAWLLKYLMKNTTLAFVWYRFGLGILLAGFLAFGMVHP